MLLTHLLVGQSGSSYNAGCGESLKSTDGMPENISGWSSDISCPTCATRLFVSHDMTKIIDLDDPRVAKKFHFNSKPWGFRWVIDVPLLYVYTKPEAHYAMCAVPVGNFVPEVLIRQCTYSDAQTAAREWVIKHGENRMPVTTGKRPQRKAKVKATKPQVPPKPAIPAGYTGVLCAKCGKIDEGDFVPNPTNMLEEVCMVCLVKAT